jgi:hypothetical protein
MISCDDNLVRMRLPAEPYVEVDDLARRVSIGHEIARMNQDSPSGTQRPACCPCVSLIQMIRTFAIVGSPTIWPSAPSTAASRDAFDFAFMIIETNPATI